MWFKPRLLFFFTLILHFCHFWLSIGVYRVYSAFHSTICRLQWSIMRKCYLLVETCPLLTAYFGQCITFFFFSISDYHCCCCTWLSRQNASQIHKVIRSANESVLYAFSSETAVVYGHNINAIVSVIYCWLPNLLIKIEFQCATNWPKFLRGTGG